MNTIMLIGRTTKEPEIRYPENGSDNGPVARITIAENFRNGNGEDEPIFWNCVAFGKTADFIQQYVGKGVKLAIAGRMTPNNYTDKEGKKVFSSQLRIQTVEFAESKSSQGQQNAQPNQAAGAMPQANQGAYVPQPNQNGMMPPMPNQGVYAPQMNQAGTMMPPMPPMPQQVPGNVPPQNHQGMPSMPPVPQQAPGNVPPQNHQGMPPMPPMPQQGFNGFAASGFADEELPFH